MVREALAEGKAHPYASKPWLAAYPDRVPAEIGAVTETLPRMLERSAARFGDADAVEFFGASLTYTELWDRVERCAEGLRGLGVSASDRVALVLPNCPQNVIAFYAVLRLGAIAIEHNPLYTPGELQHQFEDHGADVAISWSKGCDTIAAFADGIRPTTIVAVDVTAAMPLVKRLALRLPVPKVRRMRAKLTSRIHARGVVPWRRLIEGSRLDASTPWPALDDVALLQYTSGTTGVPKGAMLTHGNLRANAMQGHAWIPDLREGQETFYGVLPLFHAYGMTLCLSFAMSIGARLVLFPAFDTGLVASAAMKHPPTFFPGVPPMYDRLLDAADAGAIDLSTVRFAISGAMSLPAATVHRWEAATGGILVEGYGMTESSPVALGNPMGPARRPGAVGVPFPSTEIRVVDPDDPARDLAQGETGELLLRGPQVFQGYWGRPAETAATLVDGGWLRTGDLVRVDAAGFVTVVDRLKELIITGGVNFAPSEVEDALRGYPGIADAAVVGLPRSQGGETVVAAVRLAAASAAVDAAAVREYCRTQLAAYKIPRTIEVVDELPFSLIGKVLRKEVRERLLALQAAAAV